MKKTYLLLLITFFPFVCIKAQTEPATRETNQTIGWVLPDFSELLLAPVPSHSYPFPTLGKPLLIDRQPFYSVTFQTPLLKSFPGFSFDSKIKDLGKIHLYQENQAAFSQPFSDQFTFYGSLYASKGVIDFNRYQNSYGIQAGLKYGINESLNVHLEVEYDRNYNLMPTYTATAGINYRPNERFILESTLEYTHRQFSHYGIANHLFIHGHLGYKITDRITLHGYSGIPLYQSSALVDLFNTGYFGASIELKLSKRIGIQGGVQWQHDPFTHRMKLIPYGGLIFYNVKKQDIQYVKYYIQK